MIGLLHWLQTATSVEGTISQVLVTLKSGVRDEAEKSIRDAVIRYGTRSSSFVRNLQDGSRLELLNLSGAPFPQWFAEQFFSGVLSPYLLNVAIVHKVFHLTQIDCFEMPSSYACSLPLRKTLYGLVLAAEEGSDVAVEEFDREGKNMVRRLERPSYEVSRFGRLPKLQRKYEGAGCFDQA
uniref:Protein asteroid log 1 n=1 Tax=Ixodes ricinus TaxID=34613 RepID=V5HFY0_IXORI